MRQRPLLRIRRPRRPREVVTAAARRLADARFGAIACIIAALVCVTPSIAEPAARRSPARISVVATPIEFFDRSDRSRRRFGQLEFRGGLVLASENRDFGGLSAIRVQPDGSRFLALTDKGDWVTGRIVYDGDRPAGLAEVELAPILGPDGRPLKGRGWFDTEAIAQDGGVLFVGVERVNRIVRFDFGRHGVAARGQPIPVPPGIAMLPNNRGLECLVHVPAGAVLGRTLIAVSERGLDDSGNIRGFLIGGAAPGAFSVRRRGDFDVTDCAVIPGGDLLILERSYSLATGVRMRIRRVPLAAVGPGATVDGPDVITADMGFEIDNMEGLSVHRGADGRLVLTLVSDDNFSLLQRTLLLQFAVIE